MWLWLWGYFQIIIGHRNQGMCEVPWRNGHMMCPAVLKSINIHQIVRIRVLTITSEKYSHCSQSGWCCSFFVFLSSVHEAINWELRILNLHLFNTVFYGNKSFWKKRDHTKHIKHLKIFINHLHFILIWENSFCFIHTCTPSYSLDCRSLSWCTQRPNVICTLPSSQSLSHVFSLASCFMLHKEQHVES